MRKIATLPIYYYSVLLISVLWIIFLPKPIQNYAPVFFGLLCFPVFGLNYYMSLFRFSDALHKKQPELFQKHVVDYGIAFKGVVVAVGILTTVEDFERLDDSELYQSYILCKRLLQYTLMSFVTFAVLGIATVYAG